MNRLAAWRDSTLVKSLMLLLLLGVLCIPLWQIEALIDERGASQRVASDELALTHVGPQTLIGPLLVVPYVETWQVPQRNERGEQTGVETKSEARWQLQFPQQLDINGSLTPEERYRGIFKVPFYKLSAKLGGHFAPLRPEQLPRRVNGSSIEVLTPVLALALSDTRGLEGAPKLALHGEALAFARGVPHVPEKSWLAAGVHAPLSAAAARALAGSQPVAFQLDVTLNGQAQLAIAPLGNETSAHLTSPWAHPRFGGRFLAADRTVTGSGFDARWRITALTTQAREQLRASLHGEGARAAPAGIEGLDTFDIALVQPVNVYSMSERAVKYGVLFIGLVLMAVFMVELFKRLALHPVQYALVGLSIAVFFLLLIALSEKLGFALAYAGAAGASVALLAMYFSAVLGSARRGGSLAAYVALLYGALYGLLASESNALLLGALLVFGMLAALMLATRHVNWWRLGSTDARRAESASPA
ncbi:cell envelope integrity protein CreD [Ottowia testudinis]|uniref:Cell envelope integrity protein CreD n=1 Tax=Ottowia testudinis TaxID=2816950 RepID=A0A975CFX5_9BURK|nr:cell envelope integrity protein CreD [Ottowia testudinis]QTD45475.1 cell envelope integrity protein CreD [Ottowia testudinis]